MRDLISTREIILKSQKQTEKPKIKKHKQHNPKEGLPTKNKIQKQELQKKDPLKMKHPYEIGYLLPIPHNKI